MSSLSPEIRRKIDHAKEALVKAAEEMLNQADLTMRGDEKTFGHSQLRNLTAVAAETESPAVVLNFIRYQIGRDDKKTNWARPAGGKRLGDRFIEELDGSSGVVREALAKIREIQEDKLAEQLARMELIRYFLGFATRYLKYLEALHDCPSA